ncbi:MAG: aryl-sulfate sulfotransferase [Planctomycetota bacterium]|nr:aryl-sulfate sulfotransferase [Planctomycetota bacterium]MDA1113560.1 aryl-sulfate sulfotransferase [Planctomycetota bacterium]
MRLFSPAQPTTLGAIALCLFASCGNAEKPAPEKEFSTEDLGAQDLQALQALGYVDYVESAEGARNTGVLIHQASAIQDGINLFSIHSPCEARLMDNQGKILHSWSREGKVWGHVELLKDGSIVVPTKEEDGSFLVKLNWNNELVWRQPIPAHHDVEVLPDGSLSTLSFQRRMLPSISTEIEVRDELIVQMSAAGEVQAEYSLVDLLDSSPDWEWETVEPHLLSRDKSIIDLVHSNSVAWMQSGWEARNPLFTPGNVMVSMRHQNRVVILRPETGELLWQFGLGEISGQHDATVLESGHILMFDNGLSRGWSRAIEVDPNTKEIVWQWAAAEKEAFYTAGRGAAQRLENGNTLLLESDRGHAVEVTSAGKVVWEYFQPSENGKISTLVRMKRYPRSYLGDLLGN